MCFESKFVKIFLKASFFKIFFLIAFKRKLLFGEWIVTEGVPKYIAVRDNLRKRIDLMEPDEQLPPEVELCKQYNVSRITLRHAVDNLILEGLLVRIQGKGTFRARDVIHSVNREVISDQVQGFYQNYSESKKHIRIKVIQNDVVKDESAAHKLGLNESIDLICVKRLKYVDDVLSNYSVVYLEASRFPKVLTHDFTKKSLAEFLESDYAVKLCENDLSVHIEQLCGTIARVLQVEDKTPALAVESIVKDSFGSIIAFGAAVYTPKYGDIQFKMHISV